MMQASRKPCSRCGKLTVSGLTINGTLKVPMCRKCWK